MHIALLVKDFAVGEKFSKDGLPTKSGAEFHAENHARQLIARGHRVTIFAKKRHFYTKARENLDGIDLVRLHEPSRGTELLLRLLTTHRDVDAVYIIGTPKFAVWAILWGRFLHKPVTLALTAKMEIFAAKANWRNRIFARCTNFIATTHEIQAGFREQGGVAPERISVLAHGIDTARYTMPTQEEKEALRRAAGLAGDAHILLFCARIVRNKGIDTLLRIWPIVHLADPAARLLVVGGGKHELMQELRDMAATLDGSAIILGEVDKPDSYYRMADVYVFPSHHEALPTSLLEAMSSGLPSVVSDIGGCDDLIFDDETGCRVPTEDAEAFATRILELFRAEPKRLAMGKASRALVQRMCDYTFVAPRLEAIIRSRTPCGKDDLQPHGNVQEEMTGHGCADRIQ